jgi:acetylornithine deacetylase/succinyl-diaminopimelate desuccinylase-like protein
MTAPLDVLAGYVIEQAAIIQQIPAPTFSEQQRADYIAAEMTRLGLSDVHLDQTGNVLGCWPGGDSAPLVFSAHLDTVHRQLDLPLERTEQRLTGPGIADNSLGLAALLGLGHYLTQANAEFPGPVWLVADVCEEGLGNLNGMKALVDYFEDSPRAYIILEGLGLGQVCHRGLGVIRYRISAETAGGHSWVNYGTPSAIHELAAIISSLSEMTLPRQPRTSMNVGVIQGGTSVNTIAPSAYCEVDLRSEDQVFLTRLSQRVKQMAAQHERGGVHLEVALIGNRPAGGLPVDHPLVKLTAECLKAEGLSPTYEIGSTDANIPLSRGFPAVCVGITRGNNPHTVQEYIELEPVKTGVSQLIRLAQSAWEYTSGR